MQKFNKFIPLLKVDAVQRKVYGVATGETVDKSGEICDYEGTKPFYQAWSSGFEKATDGKSLGNVRAMHGSVAAGKVTEIVFDDIAKTIEICAHIVDDNEWKKVEEGVYTGFSQGGNYVKMWKDEANPEITRYIADPVEVSIVDNPCLGASTFQYIKADGAIEMRKFISVEKPKVETAKVVSKKLEQKWVTTDEKTFVKKEDAKAHQAKIDAEAEIAAKLAPVIDAAKALETAIIKREGEGDDVQTPAADTTETASLAEPIPATEKSNTAPPISKGKLVEKGMCNVSRLASIIDELTWLLSSVQWEAEIEQDGSTMPSVIQANISHICDTLTAMVAEETAELKAAGTDTEVVVDTDIENSAKAELQKFQDVAAAKEEAFTKAIAALQSTIETMGKRLAQVEAQPAPAKGVLFAVDKGHEVADAGKRPVEANGEQVAYPYRASPAEARAAALADKT